MVLIIIVLVIKRNHPRSNRPHTKERKKDRQKRLLFR
jgi:hypothetical protein